MALTVALVFPVALMIIVGTLFMNREIFYWLGAAGIVFFAFLLRPSFTFKGRALRRDEAPALYGALEELRRKLSVPQSMDVYLDESFNASAGETQGFFGLGKRYQLTLGIPLLVALTREQALAIVAHEFGHFSRRHGRLGHWIYRVRVGWNQLAQYSDDSDSPFDRAVAWYAREFVPFFNRLSFAHSRQCEYEADADAASAAGSKPVAEALTRTLTIGRYWDLGLRRRIDAWRLEAPQPPQDFYDRFAAAVRDFRPEEMHTWLERSLAEPAAPNDTHPALADRLRALNEPPALGSMSDNAAQSLFGDGWPAILAEYNAKWTKAASPGWLPEHLRLKHIAQPLLSADAATVRTWDADRRLARARALRAVDPAAGSNELRELHQADPSHRRTCFAYGAALLDDDNAQGLETMETLARQAPAFRSEAFSRVLAYYRRKGIQWHIDRWTAWHKQAHARLATALDKFIGDVEDGKARPGSLSGGERAVLSEAIRLDPVVTKGFLFEGETSLHYAADRPTVEIRVHSLVIVIDTAEARQKEQDEDEVGERYAALLRSLVPPDEPVVLRTHLTTEILLARYLENAVAL